ncbi:MAG: OPT/YSL family transporter [Puniceicoccales bacterium]|jgi:OPT family oligopeptide transporter|nr:OPT/YSL family transporter [Puniceicoccales bacterium]
MSDANNELPAPTPAPSGGQTDSPSPTSSTPPSPPSAAPFASPTPSSTSSIPPPPPDSAPVEVRDAYWLEHVYCAEKMPQLTLRAAVFGGFIGILACASALYTTLKIGWGFCVNITACIIAFAVFNSLRNLSRGRIREMGILENGAMSSIANVTGLTPSHTAVGVFGGLMLLDATQGSVVHGQMPWYYMMLTMLFSAALGTLIAIPLKRAVINKEQLKFPSSIALAETMRTLYANGVEALAKARCLFFGIAVGAILGVWKALPDLGGVVKNVFNAEWLDTFATQVALPQLVEFRGPLNPLNWWRLPGRPVEYGFDISLLLVGAGMIIGLRVSLSMLGTALLLNCVVLPVLVMHDHANGVFHLPLSDAQTLALAASHYTPDLEAAVVGGEPIYKVFKWSLWCGTAVLVMSGITSLALQWPMLLRAVRGVFTKKDSGTAADPLAALEVPLSWCVWGTAGCAVCLVLTLWAAFDIAPYLGLVAVALSFLTGLICTRSSGEADVNPVGAMGKVSQLLYSVLPGARGNANINLITAGVTATSGASAADLVADMKLGRLLGMNPRKQFWSQIIGVCVGTVVAVPVWMLLVPDAKALDTYNPPTAIMWKTVAEFLTNANSALPDSVKIAMVVGALVGIALPVLEKLFPARRLWVPSSMGVGLAMVLPQNIPNALAFSLGAVLMWFWQKKAPVHNDKYGVPLASGFVAGESLAAAFIAIAMTLMLQWPNIEKWLTE